MVNKHGIIIHNSKHKKGRRHDYDIYKKNHPVTPKQVVNVFDLGYLRRRERLSRTTIIHTEQKKEKYGTVTRRNNTLIKNHAKKRIVIEHTICRLKKYRIMSEVFRNKLRKYNKVSDIVSGLVNYRINES